MLKYKLNKRTEIYRNILYFKFFNSNNSCCLLSEILDRFEVNTFVAAENNRSEGVLDEVLVMYFIKASLKNSLISLILPIRYQFLYNQLWCRLRIMSNSHRELNKSRNNFIKDKAIWKPHLGVFPVFIVSN